MAVYLVVLGYVGVKCGPAARAPRAFDICSAVNGDIEGCLCEAAVAGCVLLQKALSLRGRRPWQSIWRC